MLAFAGEAWGAVSTANLSYLRAPGAEDCPDERWIRQAVSARLGTDPFVDRGDLSIAAEVRRSGAQAKGTVTVTGKQGEPLGSRELVSAHGDCFEVASAMELAISIALDPTYLIRP